jgi:2-oxoisovalerate dehydrogenase E1 component beta subunit
LKVVVPSTAYDAKGLIKSSVRDNNPVIFFEHKYLYRRIKDEVPDTDYVVPLGKAAVRREGNDIAIITYGAMVWTALEAAEMLARDGISLEVVDLRTLLPYDEQCVLSSVRKCGKVVLLHEDTRIGGMAGELAAVIAEKAFEDLDGPVVRIAALDTPVPFSPPLEDNFLPNVQQVADAARQLAAY